MSDQRDGGIAWTEETWNPIRGCSRVSDGCVNCYAEKQGARLVGVDTKTGKPRPYEGLIRLGPNGPRWTGEVRMVPERLGDPLRWQRPRMIFANSMSDLFHEKFSNEEIAAVFGVMAASPHHTFQVLTKRAERMRDWFDWVQRLEADGMRVQPDIACRIQAANLLGDEHAGKLMRPRPSVWPLPNVWLGVSAEDQERADERVPLLLECAAAVRWVSYEPALGLARFSRWLMAKADRERRQGAAYWAFTRQANAAPPSVADPEAYRPSLDWIVVGGESGDGARRFDLGWARSVLREFRAAGVPYFFKQAGSNATDSYQDEDGARLDLGHSKGGDLAELPEDLRVREFPRKAA